METFRKTAAVLIFPVLAGLLLACHGEGPTGPGPGTTGLPGGGNATTRWVNDDGIAVPPGSSCSNPGYRHIQDAVEAAAPGDKIKVCAGTYPEQVKVRVGKNDIQLISVQRWKAVIQAPAAMLPDEGDVTQKSIVRVTVATNVTILAFTITGPGDGCQLNYGVRADNQASAKILGNHITKIRDALTGCQNGTAVIVGRQTSASAQILGNVIDDYEANGPTVVNGSSAEISYNRILGRPNASTNQNGIQVGDGSSATVRHNFIAQNTANPALGAGTGMFLYGGASVVSEHNTVTSNDYGIYELETAPGSSVTESRIRSSTYDGVVLAASNGNQVTHNASEHNALTGVYLWGDAGRIQSNHIVRDQIQNNAFGGILLDDASNNEIRANHVKDNGTETANPDVTDGIRINAGSGNMLTDNHLKRNVTHDCHDILRGSC